MMSKMIILIFLTKHPCPIMLHRRLSYLSDDCDQIAYCDVEYVHFEKLNGTDNSQ